MGHGFRGQDPTLKNMKTASRTRKGRLSRQQSPVLGKEVFGGEELGGEGERTAFKVEKIALGRRVGVVVLDLPGNDEAVILVEGNQVPVESGIVRGGKAQAVFGIQAVFHVLGPRADVAGAEDVGHRQPRHATAVAVVRQHHLAENLLVDAHFHRREARLPFLGPGRPLLVKVGPGGPCNQLACLAGHGLADRLVRNFRDDSVLERLGRHELAVGSDRRRAEIFRPVAWRVEVGQHLARRSLPLLRAHPLVETPDFLWPERMPDGAIDDRRRIVLGQNRPQHVQRPDIGGRLPAFVRVGRIDEIAECLPQHGSSLHFSDNSPVAIFTRSR